jgi:UDP:flavonoid glycosyltransferase YjiC (YdhE family)
VHGDGADAALRSRFHAASLRFEDQPLDLAEVGRTCDLAILNGNHGTTVSMLLAGKPTLQVPIFLEQALFSQAVARLGAAIVALPDQRLDAVAGLMELLASQQHAEAARQFAARYAGYDPERQIVAMVDRVEELLRPG